MKHARFVLAALFMTMMTIGTFEARAAAPKTEPIAETHAIKLIAEEAAEAWADGNISTGTTGLSVVTITSKLPDTKDGWQDLAVELFKERFKYFVEEDVPTDAKLRISAAPFDAGKHLQAAADAIAESNAYDPSNPDTSGEILGVVKSLVSALGDPKDIQFLAIKTRLMDEKVTDAKRNVRIHSFINTKDGTAMLLFTIEGTM